MSEPIVPRKSVKSAFDPDFVDGTELVIDPSGTSEYSWVRFLTGSSVRRTLRKFLEYRQGPPVRNVLGQALAFNPENQLIDDAFIQEVLLYDDTDRDNACRIRLSVHADYDMFDIFGEGGPGDAGAYLSTFVKDPVDGWVGEFAGLWEEEDSDDIDSDVMLFNTSPEFCARLKGLGEGVEMAVALHTLDNRPYLQQDEAADEPYAGVIASVEQRIRNTVQYEGADIPIIEERDSKRDMYLLRPRFLWDFDRDKECAYQNGQLEIEAYADRGRFRDAFVYDLLQEIARNLDTLAADGWTPDGVPRLATDVIEVEAAEDQYHHGYLSMTAGT